MRLFLGQIVASVKKKKMKLEPFPVINLALGIFHFSISLLIIFFLPVHDPFLIVSNLVYIHKFFQAKVFFEPM